MLKYLLLNFFFQSTISLTTYTQLLFRNKGYSHSLVGVMMAIGQVASVLVPILICGISDRTRKTKLMTFVITAIGVLLFIPSATLGSVWLTGVVFFIASGLYWSINPMLDGYQNRMFKGNSSQYGIARAAGTMGYVVALILFGLIGFPVETDNLSICLCFCLTTALFLIAASFVPGDLPLEPGQETAQKKSFSFGNFSKKFYLMMLIVGLSRVAQAIPDKLLASYMTEVLNLGNKFTFFYALGAFCEFVMMIIGGKLLEKGKVSSYTMILLSCIGLVVRLLIYYFFPNIYAFTFAQMFHSLTFACLHIGVMKFISQNVDKEHYSLATSLYWSVATNLPQTIGVLAGGFIIQNLGYPMLFLIYCAFPVIAVALCFVYDRLYNRTVKA
ncbi:MAG: MFS transporter [Sphaerochaetaceae bacterium]|nr:MFS transporter [Sphaerochaetaceae bacterium]